MLNPNSGQLSWLTGEDLPAVRENPSWAPSGDKLAYTQDNMLYTTGVQGEGEKEMITPFGSGIYHPSWSSQDELLLLYFPQKRYPQIWLSLAESTDWRAITPEIAFQFDPVWSPDGRIYAFSGGRGTIVSQWLELIFGGFQFTYYDIKPRDIFLVDAQTGEMTQLTRGLEDEFQPAWSPDGQKLAFVSIQDKTNPEIMVVNRDGSELVRLTNHPAQDIYPSWSPDGSLIALSTDRDGNFEIYVMNQDGSSPLRLTANLMDDFQPVWSPAPERSKEVYEGATYKGDLNKFRPKLLTMEQTIQWLYRGGLISTDQGKKDSLYSFSEAWAQINWYQYFPTGHRPRDFVLRTDASRESASDKANWFNSGCGFVFREKDVDNHYMIHLGMDGFVYLMRYKNGIPSRISSSSLRYPLETPADKANLMLAMEDDTIHFFVNGLLMLTKQDKSFDSGRLHYTLSSGTNKDFGTRCSMDNVELWTIEK